MSLANPRDPIGDHLLTPQNAAMVLIDYQPSQFAASPVDRSRPPPARTSSRP